MVLLALRWVWVNWTKNWRIELCGETIAEKSRRGYAWQILQVLRETNDHGRHVHVGSRILARRLDPEPVQNTLIRAICSLRSRIRKIVRGGAIRGVWAQRLSAAPPDFVGMPPLSR